ncbi:MAG: glycerol-3-phosphate dehydrogenase/oxidase [Solirubrobacteraceae bacterium]
MSDSPGALNEHSRRRALDAMASGDLDVLVVGGGITGAGAALDAATRGLKVGLVEAADLASGTSSKSSKLIHGGLRYLEMGDIGLVREALRERELLLTKLAPHLVSPVPFLWPLRGRAWERAYLGTGLALYDRIGGARSVPAHRHLSRRGALAHAPALRPGALVGAVRFFDGAEDDARLVLTVARTAAAEGAHVVTRARVRELIVRDGAVCGAVLVDELSGVAVAAHARRVAVAAGVWTDSVRELGPGSSPTRVMPSKGVHITVARDRIQMGSGLLSRTERSVLFVIPYGSCWLIGDTDTPWLHGPQQPVASGADVDYLLAKVNALLAKPLTKGDVRGVFAGLRPLVVLAAGGAVDTARISRKHVIERPAPGLTTIAGGKLTIYRVMAADLIGAATEGLDHVTPSRTVAMPLLGASGFAGAWERRAAMAERAGIDVSTMELLLGRYGALAADLVALTAARPQLAQLLPGGDGHIGAEVVYACTHEGALTLEDVLERRTRLALTAPDRGMEAAAPAAALMAAALGWEPGRARQEVDGWRRRVAAQRAGERQPDDERALGGYREALQIQVEAAR